MPPLTNLNGTFLRGGGLVLGGVIVFDHLSEHAVARFDGAVHVASQRWRNDWVRG